MPVLQNVKPDVYAVVDYLKTKGVSSIGTVGFCWGAAMSVQAATDSSVFKVAALLHPSLFNKEKELCPAAKVPLAVVSAQGELWLLQRNWRVHAVCLYLLLIYVCYSSRLMGLQGAQLWQFHTWQQVLIQGT